MSAILKAKNINFKYDHDAVLTDINVHFEEGKVHAIIGKSGSGKTTLLSILSGICNYQEGSVLYKGEELSNVSLAKYRKETSIIFQSFNLISYLNAIQNIIISLDIMNDSGNKKEKAINLLQQVGISEKDWYRPCNKLSGGQQQRVAIARSLACESRVIFADEPTGNLDSQTSKEITNLICDLAQTHNKCVICVTHDTRFKKKADVVYLIKDGKILNH